MKEFNAQTGGRYTYVDDIVNLQELALAFVSIFDDCDNFIISGCQIGSDSIDAGYVYINGKIRRFAGASNITEWPQYLYESNRTETVAYASGDDKVGRNVYGCALSPSLPSTPDPLTGEAPKAIIIDRREAPPRINDAFFGKYALLLNHPRGGQSVAGELTIEDVKVKRSATANNITLRGNLGAMNVRYDTDNNVVVSLHRNNVPYPYSIKFTQSDIQIINDNGLKTVFNKAGVETRGAYLTNVLKISTIQIDSNGISIPQGTDDQTLYINRIGNGRTYYRNTAIGNGKGQSILSVFGSSSSVQIEGSLNIESADGVALRLNATQLIQWNNKSGTGVYVGLQDTGVFEIKSVCGNITISGTQYVNISPAIKEGGQLLSEKYVQQTTFNKQLEDKANANDVYTKSISDNKYACLGGGLQQLKGNYSYDVLCGQIGAASKTYVDNTFISLNELVVSGLGLKAQEKKKACENIGAAYADDYQKKTTDTGWIPTAPSIYPDSKQLYVRQVGNIVYIQGKAKVHQDHRWNIPIPNTISPPAHAVSFTYRKNSTTYWTGWIEADTRIIQTAGQNGMKGDEIPITISYMV